MKGYSRLTHWGRVMHICVGNLTIISSDNGLSPGRGQAIIWTNAEILLIGPLDTNFSEILIKILTFSFKKMCLKVSSAKWRPFCLGLNVLTLVVLNFIFRKHKIIIPFFFLLFLNIEVPQVVEIPPCGRPGPVDPAVNIMAADGLVMQGARASAAMILT